ncbi:hypothetical protein NQ315_013589 [Exocentrus adspersus]|uniref:Centromere protein J C-terminal domain-containing protein n=1 Tax=Exocentrus adspersus TaxID=1586481 RepID=A0AAV8W466_9CUCU|nr:hypothetical protein NQ315_013589 [Exocentrus adspersus]
MSYFPSPVLVRLQELKLWQGNYDSLLQKSKAKNGQKSSDNETMDGLSPLDSTRSSPFSSPERGKLLDWDKREISPSKPFEQLLEEKLAQDKPVHIQAKPKRPFLRKGAGLARYKLNQQPYLPKKPRNKSPVGRICKQITNKKNSNVVASKSRTTRLLENKKAEPGIDLTPLKMPDLSIKPKATWQKVLETEKSKQKEGNNKLADTFKNSFNSHILGKICDFNLKQYLPSSPRRTILNRNSESIGTILEAEVEVESSPSIHSHQASDKTLDNELRIFEALEDRVEHSSFSSTNSSIIRLLCSTPSKIQPKTLPTNPILEEQNIETNVIPSGFHPQGIQNTLLQNKLKEVNKRTDVLHDFLRSLRRIGDNGEKRSSVCSAESTHDKSTESSFSDEEKWSSNTEIDKSRSLSTFFTETDTTCRNDTAVKVDAAVNTSTEQKEECVQSEPCQNCEELQTKLDKITKQLPDIQAEKAKICDFAKELENKRDQLSIEIEKLKLKHESVISQMQEELESEKEEICSRKDDTKELLKLKETKNGATQARLRTQIKQLEKENGELKLEVEKLQKENGKLNAAQLLRRPSEVKMLHEINRNLTKLTEETLKKQTEKAEASCNTENNEELKKKHSRKSKGAGNHENDSPKVKKKTSCIKHNSTEASSTNDTSKHDMTTFADLSLEKQYETVFGQFSSPGMSNNSLNDSKRERAETVFEDGSKEIKYSNGNTKTISPDGNLAVVKYYNGDIKETNLLENTLKYYYAESAIWHTQYGDGLEVLEYPNGQKETRYKDGKREVKCPDGSMLVKKPDGTEEVDYPDGTKMIKTPDGEKILILSNGQKEIHTKEHKRREYPDGTVKILYPDGTQETRYASGRIRIKDPNGILIMDSQNSLL